MGHKVIHVSDDLHALVKKHCDQNGHQMRVWAEVILLQEIKRGSMAKEKVAPIKKKLPKLPGGSINDKPKPWEQEPFWKQSGGNKKPLMPAEA